MTDFKKTTENIVRHHRQKMINIQKADALNDMIIEIQRQAFTSINFKVTKKFMEVKTDNYF